MKTKAQVSSVLNIVYRVLLGIFLCLVAVFLAGTIYSFFSGNENPAPGITDSIKSDSPDSRIFTGIGRLRLPANNEATVIISIDFPYVPEDLAFSEELAARVNDFRIAAAEFFLPHTAVELRLMDEEEIKKEILDRFNRILRLGKIETIYFNDFFIIE